MFPQPLTPVEIMLRIGAALLAGFLIGLEREINGKTAGLRTTVLVCVSTTVVIVIAYLGLEQAVLSGAEWRPDPNRVIQGVLTGVGFIGAGNILRQGTIIRGLTTAAGLWYVTALGIAFGSGYFTVGAGALVVALAVLYLLPLIERRLNNERFASVVVELDMDGASPSDVRAFIRQSGATIERFDLHYDLREKSKTIQLDVSYRVSRKVNFAQRVTDGLIRLAGVHQVKWDQQN